MRRELEGIKRRLEVQVEVKLEGADFEEAEHLCKVIEEKDRELMVGMMRQRDEARRDWLKNWVDVEVGEFIRRDREDVRNHIEMYSEDVEKMNRVIDKLAGQRKEGRTGEKEMKDIEKEMNALMEERKACEQEYKRNEQEQLRLKQECDKRRLDLDKRDHQIQKLCQDIQRKDGDIERLNGILAEKDELLEDIEEDIKQTGGNIDATMYSGIKGDLVDELLAKYINLTQCTVPIKRLGNGYYLFGTKKIFAKIMNNKLVIRVGGGFMVIEEFIAAYAD